MTNVLFNLIESGESSFFCGDNFLLNSSFINYFALYPMNSLKAAASAFGLLANMTSPGNFFSVIVEIVLVTVLFKNLLLKVGDGLSFSVF